MKFIKFFEKSRLYQESTERYMIQLYTLINMDIVNVIGLTAAFLTTVSSLPQVIKTIKLKETREISFWMWTFLSIGIFLWLIYGIYKNDMPIILANSVSLFLVLIVLVLKIKYK